MTAQFLFLTLLSDFAVHHFGERNGIVLVKEMAENVWKMLAVRLRSAVSGISQH
jgi:hypothetical protein